MFSLIKPMKNHMKFWSCLRSAEFSRQFSRVFWLPSLQKKCTKNSLTYTYISLAENSDCDIGKSYIMRCARLKKILQKFGLRWSLSRVWRNTTKKNCLTCWGKTVTIDLICVLSFPFLVCRAEGPPAWVERRHRHWPERGRGGQQRFGGGSCGVPYQGRKDPSRLKFQTSLFRMYFILAPNRGEPHFSVKRKIYENYKFKTI